MKLFLTTLLVCAMIAGAVWWWHSTLSAAENLSAEITIDDRKYSNVLHGYSVDWPASYTIDESISELVLMQGANGSLRINSGCYDFGLEDLQSVSIPIQINNESVMKEQLYDEYKLRLTRFSFTKNDLCYSLELLATSESGWQELEGLATSFRIR